MGTMASANTSSNATFWWLQFGHTAIRRTGGGESGACLAIVRGKTPEEAAELVERFSPVIASARATRRAAADRPGYRIKQHTRYKVGCHGQPLYP
jgi:hypothetical protein